MGWPSFSCNFCFAASCKLEKTPTGEVSGLLLIVKYADGNMLSKSILVITDLDSFSFATLFLGFCILNLASAKFGTNPLAGTNPPEAVIFLAPGGRPYSFAIS